MTNNGASEVDFYRHIVEVPQYQTYSKFFRLLDPEDPQKIVEDDLVNFKQLYEPIVQTAFENKFVLEDGVFK